MVDVDIDEIKRFLEAYEELKASAADTAAIDKMKGAIDSMNPIMETWRQRLSAGTTALGNMTSTITNAKFDDFIGGITNMNSSIKDLMENVDLSSGKLKELGVEIGAVYAAASGRLAISDELLRLTRVADGSSASMTHMLDRVTRAAPELADALGPLPPLIKNAFSQVDAARNLETSLLMNAAAAGNLDAAYGSLADGIDSLSDMSLEFSRLTRDVGTANNLTAGQVADYATQLMRIPGALGQVVDATDGSNAQSTMLDATIRVAAGTFQRFEDVMKDVDLLFRNWNKTGRDSLEFVARLSNAAQSLKMPMDIMREYVHGVGNQFKFLGDNTGSAIDIMTRFGPALRRSGLGPAAMNELVQNMTGAVAKMDVAQRAFVSAQTGGPGGLQGGYQLALQMQRGDMAGVFQQVENTLRGMFGGQIVTLDQAAQDVRAASQMTRQVQMLTTGPLAIAGSEAEAFRILDALASGTVPTQADVTTGQTPDDMLNSAMQRGNDIQQRQFNELIRVNNQLEYLGSVAADVAYANQRQFIGVGTDIGAERSMRAEVVRTEALQRAAQTRFQEEIPEGGRAEEIRSVVTGIEDAFKGVTQTVGDMFGGLAGAARTAIPTAAGEPLGFAPLPAGIEPIAGAGGEVGALPAGRLHRDMLAAERIAAEERPRERLAVAGRGRENTLVVQVMSDDQIKRLVRVVIDEEGEMRMVDEGKVARGL